MHFGGLEQIGQIPLWPHVHSRVHPPQARSAQARDSETLWNRLREVQGREPGSRPPRGGRAALGMLSAMFPNRISITQSEQSYPQDYRFASVFPFLFVF